MLHKEPGEGRNVRKNSVLSVNTMFHPLVDTKGMSSVYAIYLPSPHHKHYSPCTEMSHAEVKPRLEEGQRRELSLTEHSL